MMTVNIPSWVYHFIP